MVQWVLDEFIFVHFSCFQVEENYQSWIFYTHFPILPREGEVVYLMVSLGWGTGMASPCGTTQIGILQLAENKCSDLFSAVW